MRVRIDIHDVVNRHLKLLVDQRPGLVAHNLIGWLKKQVDEDEPLEIA